MSAVSRPCSSNSPASFMIQGTAFEPAMALQPKTSLSAALEEQGRETMSKNESTTGSKKPDVLRFGSEPLEQSIFIIASSKRGMSVGCAEFYYSVASDVTCPIVCSHRYKLSIRSRRESPGSQGF